MDVLPRLTDLNEAVSGCIPPSWAESWDNVGLQVGDPEAEVTRVVTAVDPSLAVMAEAAALGAGALVTHHPLILHPLKRFTQDEPVSRAVLALHEHGLGLVVAHTNLDYSEFGPSAHLARELDLRRVEVFPTAARGRLVKFVVFVPEEALESVRRAMARAGAGRLGDYAECSFRTPGTGTFRPLPGARPHTGAVGEVEHTPEYRLEATVPEADLETVVSAVLEVHPYEEVAYDVYVLENAGEARGGGRVGDLPEPVPLRQLAETLHRLLHPVQLRQVGPGRRPVRRVAIVAGSGGDFVARAEAAGADVLITGDTRHHQATLAESLGLCLLDPGHHETERSAAVALADILRRAFPDELTVTVATTDRSPYEPGGDGNGSKQYPASGGTRPGPPRAV